MLASAVRQSGLDMPLGRLDKLVLTDAAKCLDGIKTAIEELTELRKAQSLDTEAVRTALEKIAGLSGEFYQLIPHRESANGPIAPFNSLEEVKQKSDMLQSLNHIQLGAKIVMGASQRPDMHPADYCYSALDIRLESLHESADEDELRALRQYLLPPPMTKVSSLRLFIACNAKGKLLASLCGVTLQITCFFGMAPKPRIWWAF